LTKRIEIIIKEAASFSTFLSPDGFKRREAFFMPRSDATRSFIALRKKF
jgi:hypothetical protein